MVTHIMLIGRHKTWALKEIVEVLLHVVQVCETEILEALVPIVRPTLLVSEVASGK